MKEFAKKFYRSRAWRACRKSYIAERQAIDGGLCEECGERLGYIVHHKTLLTPKNIDNPEITLNHKMLKYVCKECHNREDVHPVGIIKKVPLLCSFDAGGQPYPPCSKKKN